MNSNSANLSTLIARRPGAVAAGILLGTFVATVALTVLATASALDAVVDRLAANTHLTVFIEPKASRADAEQVGERLRGLPDVRAAALVPKEAAMQRLVDRSFPAPSDQRNPLPDAWTLSIRPLAAEPDFAARVESVRVAAAAVDGVQSVVGDTAWVRRLGDWGIVQRQAHGPVAWVALGLVALLMLTIGWNAAAALRTDGGAPVLVGACIGLVVGLMSVAVGFALVAHVMAPAVTPFVPDFVVDATFAPSMLVLAVVALSATLGGAIGTGPR